MKLLRRLLWFIVLGSTILAACATRTIYVPDGEPVRLRETIRDAKVWVLDAGGQPVAGVMDLPEGWYCLPVPAERESPLDQINAALVRVDPAHAKRHAARNK